MNEDQTEFDDAMIEIAKQSFLLDSVPDRVMCTEWLSKLLDISSPEEDLIKIKNEYIQYLKIMVEEKVFHGPFKKVPPELYLLPLSEYLGQLIFDEIPRLPKSGPVAPVISHSSSDGRATLSAQRLPGGGIFFYMAVSPDGL